MKRVFGLLLALCVMFVLTSTPSFSQPQDQKKEEKKGEKGEKKKGEGKKKGEKKDDK